MARYVHDMNDQVIASVNSLTEKELENSDDSLELILASQFKIDEIKLSEPYRKDGGERDVDISRDNRFWVDSQPYYKKAKVVEVHIPFEGNSNFLRIEPSTTTMLSVKGRIIGNEIVGDFTFFPDVDNIDNVKNEIDSWLKSVRQNVGWMNNDLRNFSQGLFSLIPREIKRRRNHLNKAKEIIDGLGLPEKSEDRVLGFIKPIQKIEIKIKDKKTNDEIEYILDKEVYDTITQTVNSLGINLERCSNRVRNLDEESLRDTFFMALNSTFKGLVSTETFNKNGKTDLIIRYGDKNLYVSECKIWDGDKYFLEGIDQLLNNLTWRDSKCSYIVFSRNKDFGKVIEKSKELVGSHESHVSFIRKVSENCFEFKLKNKNDSQKHIYMTLHLFTLV